MSHFEERDLGGIARSSVGRLEIPPAALNWGSRIPKWLSKRQRRRFTAERYKLRIVREADCLQARVTVTLLVFCVEIVSRRRSSWRRQRDEIAKMGMRRESARRSEDPRVKELERENARLRLARGWRRCWRSKKKPPNYGDPPESTRERPERLIVAAEELAGRIGQTAEACEALGVARSTLYRRRQR